MSYLNLKKFCDFMLCDRVIGVGKLHHLRRPPLVILFVFGVGGCDGFHFGIIEVFIFSLRYFLVTEKQVHTQSLKNPWLPGYFSLIPNPKEKSLNKNRSPGMTRDQHC